MSRWSPFSRVLVAVAALVLVVFALMVGIRWATADGTHADPETGGVVVLNGIALSVDSAMPAHGSEDRTVWLGSRAPEPRFDTSALGQDWSFAQREPPVGVFDGFEGDVVFFGYRGEEPMAIHATAAVERNPWDHIYAFFTGHRERRLLDATFPCCAFGYSDGDGLVHPEVLYQAPLIGGPVMQWLGVPDGTSVVAIQIHDEPVGYQRPVGGIVTVELEVAAPFDLTVTAFDVSGMVLMTESWTVHAIDGT